MALKSALTVLQSRILNKRLHEGEGSKSLESGGSGNLKFSLAPEPSGPEPSTLEVQPLKKQKGKKVVMVTKEVIRVDADDAPTLENRPEDNILARKFPYPEFMDKAVVTSAVLDQIRGDDDSIMDRFQWIGRMLLKLVTILRCLEPPVSFGIHAYKEVKDLRESLHLLKVEKLAPEEERQKLTSDLAEVKESARLKDQCLEEKDCQLEESVSWIIELEKSDV